MPGAAGPTARRPADPAMPETAASTGRAAAAETGSATDMDGSDGVTEGVEEATGTGAELDHGTYEVLRARLAEHAAELGRRADALNARRLEVFGGTELRLAGTERIRTAHDCVPRDVVALGDVLLFGGNALLGPTPETAVEDVFSLHRLTRGEEGVALVPAGPEAVPGLLDDPEFLRDFAGMYRYYRQARLLQLRLVDGRLLAVFQTGPRLTDLRVLRWRTAPDGGVVYEDDQESAITRSRRRTTSTGSRPRATTTSPAGTRTSRSRARCSSARPAGH